MGTCGSIKPAVQGSEPPLANHGYQITPRDIQKILNHIKSSYKIIQDRPRSRENALDFFFQLHHFYMTPHTAPSGFRPGMRNFLALQTSDTSHLDMDLQVSYSFYTYDFYRSIHNMTNSCDICRCLGRNLTHSTHWGLSCFDDLPIEMKWEPARATFDAPSVELDLNSKPQWNSKGDERRWFSSVPCLWHNVF